MLLPMTATELQDLLARWRWTPHELADCAGRDYERVRKMVRGARPIDPPLARWLRALDKRRTPAVVMFEDRFYRERLTQDVGETAEAWATRLRRCAELANRLDVREYQALLDNPPPPPLRILHQEQRQAA